MRFDVGDRLLHPTPVSQREDDVAHVPILIPVLLQQLNPLVGDCHGQAVVEAQATFADWPAQTRHTGYILGKRETSLAKLSPQSSRRTINLLTSAMVMTSG